MAKPADKSALTGLKKRQQIEAANKQIFIWVAVASVIVSFCLIALQFLGKEFLFNQKIINAKTETNQQLIDNVAAAKELKTNVDALLSDSHLSALQKEGEESQSSNLSVILDALPVTGDATNFANSLQEVVLPRSGVTIRELSTSTDQFSTEDLEVDSETPLAVPFSTGFVGNYNEVRRALSDMALVIRPVNPIELTISGADTALDVEIRGATYYLPARSIEVTTKALEP